MPDHFLAAGLVGLPGATVQFHVTAEFDPGNGIVKTVELHR